MDERSLTGHLSEAVETALSRLAEKSSTFKFPGMSQEMRQGLAICLIAELGPSNPRLTHEADTFGLYMSLQETVRSLTSRKDEQRQILNEVLRRLMVQFTMGVRAEPVPA